MRRESKRFFDSRAASRAMCSSCWKHSLANVIASFKSVSETPSPTKSFEKDKNGYFAISFCSTETHRKDYRENAYLMIVSIPPRAGNARRVFAGRPGYVEVMKQFQVRHETTPFRLVFKLYAKNISGTARPRFPCHGPPAPD